MWNPNKLVHVTAQSLVELHMSYHIFVTLHNHITTQIFNVA